MASRGSTGLRAWMVIAAVFGGPGLGAALVACGAKPALTPIERPAVSGEAATLAVFVWGASTNATIAVGANPALVVQEELVRQRYHVVDKVDEADVQVSVEMSNVRLKSMFATTEYTMDISIVLADREMKPIMTIGGGHWISEPAQDEREIASLAARLTTSPKLAAYAESSKQARAERRRKQEQDQKDAEAEKHKAADRVKSDEALGNAEALRKEIEATLKRDEGAVPAEKLDALRRYVDVIQAGNPDAGRFYAHRYTSLFLENAWSLPGDEPHRAIARALGADVVTSGKAGGKALSVTWSAKAGSCYAVISRFEKGTGEDNLRFVVWKSTAGNTVLQRYFIIARQHGLRGQPSIEGACATKDTSITMSADLPTASSRNGFRYVVVGTPKARFPMYLAAFMTIRSGDECDSEAWYQLWADPIPGTMVYRGSEPFLLDDVDAQTSPYVELHNVAQGETTLVKKDEVSSTPPSEVSFATPLRFRGCKPHEPESSSGRKLEACYHQAAGKFRGPLTAALRARAAAKTEDAVRAAQEQEDKARATYDAEVDKFCKPVNDQIDGEWQAVFNKIVDLYKKSPPKAELKRAEEIAGQYRGRPPED